MTIQKTKPTEASATFAKNSREEIRVSVDTFKGHTLVDLRVWFRGNDGEMRPSRKGISIRTELLSDVVGALQKMAADLGEGASV